MDSQESAQPSKRFRLKDSLGNTWNSSYSFVQPKLKRLVRPSIYAVLGGAAILGIQNRNEVKGAVGSEIPSVKATLIKEPMDLELQIQPIDDNTSEWLPKTTEASILICNDVSANGSECQTDTVYFTAEDVSKKRVKIDGSTIEIQKPLLEANQTRPWIRVSKER